MTDGRLSRIGAVITVVGFPVAVAVSALLGRAAGGAAWSMVAEALPLAIPFGAFGLVGALILWRRPGHAVGVICVGMAALYALTALAIGYAGWSTSAPQQRPGGLLALWLASWTWYPMLGAATVALPLVIPDGRLPSPRWRWVAALGAAAVGGMIMLAMLHVRLPTFEGDATVANPVGVPGVPSPIDSVASNVLLAAMLVAFAAAVASIVFRYRRAGSEDRTRLKWIVFAFASMLAVNLILEVVQARYLPAGISNAVWAALWMILPIGIGIAVLRHRLFDIDRIVSRTVAYTLVTVVLAAVYVAGVVGLGALLRAVTGGGGGDLVIAASTLLVAAAFGPVRRRAQAAVDRRFNRARYDAARVVEAFGQRLRDEVDLERLVADVRGVTVQAIQPADVSLWLRTTERMS